MFAFQCLVVHVFRCCPQQGGSRAGFVVSGSLPRYGYSRRNPVPTGSGRPLSLPRAPTHRPGAAPASLHELSSLVHTSSKLPGRHSEGCAAPCRCVEDGDKPGLLSHSCRNTCSAFCTQGAQTNLRHLSHVGCGVPTSDAGGEDGAGWQHIQAGPQRACLSYMGMGMCKWKNSKHADGLQAIITFTTVLRS